jgi:hypothetical protein
MRIRLCRTTAAFNPLFDKRSTIFTAQFQYFKLSNRCCSGRPYLSENEIRQRSSAENGGPLEDLSTPWSL